MVLPGAEPLGRRESFFFSYGIFLLNRGGTAVSVVFLLESGNFQEDGVMGIDELLVMVNYVGDGSGGAGLRPCACGRRWAGDEQTGSRILYSNRGKSKPEKVNTVQIKSKL